MKKQSVLQAAEKIEYEANKLGCRTEQGRKKLWQALEICQGYLSTSLRDCAAWDKCGEILVKLGCIADAVTCYAKVRSIDSGFFERKCIETGACLRNGEYEKGWLGFERRLVLMEQDVFYRMLVGKKRWYGEKLAKEQVLLIHAEQGLGDTIQFMRFLPMVRKRVGACKIIFVVQRDVACLLKDLSSCYDELLTYALGETLVLPEFDVAVGLMSLPLILAINDEKLFWTGNYITADDGGATEKKLLPQGLPNCTFDSALRVGLVWKAGKDAEYDKIRSLSIADCRMLKKISHVNWYSLQKGDIAQDLKAMKACGLDIVDLSADIDSFSDTMSFIVNMDVVVTVDTAVAHLAGAMGKKTALLLNITSLEWRWRDKQDNSAWYPATKIFWQEKQHCWQDAIKKIIKYLDQLK